MKKVTLAVAALTAIMTAPMAFAAPSVLIETVTIVGFAPPEYRGIFKTQITSDGSIVAINNKDVSTVVAKLAKQTVKNLKTKISELKVGELVGEDGPGCMDAPSSAVTVYKDGQEIVIKTRAECKEKEMYEAYELNSVMTAASTLSQLNQQK